jgi:flagellar assembly protein FliH
MTFMHAAPHIRPFAFDRVFAVLPGGAQRAQAADLQLELDCARAEIERLQGTLPDELARARADGFEAGLAQARTEREAALLLAADALHAAIEGMEEDLAEARRGAVRDAAEAALAAADLVAGRALEQLPLQAVEEALERAIDQAGRGADLLVKVHPSLKEEMARLLELRESRERRRMSLRVAADPALAPGDAVITWDEGGLVLDRDARRAAVVAELAPLIGANPPAFRSSPVP